MTVTVDDRVNQPVRARRDFRIALPPADLALSQDQEWCVVRLNGAWQEIRLHDYDELFSIPGLYERIIYDILKCDSPRRIRALLEAELPSTGDKPRDLRVLDLGAGNGMVGEELADCGAKYIVGVDIIDAAAMATRRDRPGVYEDYLIVDMTKSSEVERSGLAEHDFNCLTCVAALGFGDIPARAFATAFNLVADGGWVAFNIKSQFLDKSDESGFATLIRSMINTKQLEIRRSQEYRHRVGTNREPIQYTAIVGIKHGDVDLDTID